MRERGKAASASACLWKWEFAYGHLDTHGAKLKRFKSAWSSLDLNLYVTLTVTTHQAPRNQPGREAPLHLEHKVTPEEQDTTEEADTMDYAQMNSRTIFTPFWTWQLGTFQLGDTCPERDTLPCIFSKLLTGKRGLVRGKEQSTSVTQVVIDCKWYLQRILQAGGRHVNLGM